jgi:hypothetical protein
MLGTEGCEPGAARSREPGAKQLAELPQERAISPRTSDNEHSIDSPCRSTAELAGGSFTGGQRRFRVERAERRTSVIEPIPDLDDRNFALLWAVEAHVDVTPEAARWANAPLDINPPATSSSEPDNQLLALKVLVVPWSRRPWHVLEERNQLRAAGRSHGRPRFERRVRSLIALEP